ncbi:hypothetical protein ACSQ67_007781 [Phaseolus vulgaris]
MISAPFSTPTATFSPQSVSSPQRHIKFRSTVSFATATATATATSIDVLSPQSMASCTTLYEVLGVRPAASEGEIKAAYRQLVRVCHPDVAPVGQKESSAGEFMKIHNAYRTLLNPEKRAKYDRSLFPRGRVVSTAASRVSSYGGRRWETDQCW